MSSINVKISKEDIRRKKKLGKEVTWHRIVKRGLKFYEYYVANYKRNNPANKEE